MGVDGIEGEVRQIIQLLPAEGWYALWADCEAGEGEEWYKFDPLVAWALIQHADYGQRVEGLVADGEWDVGFAEEFGIYPIGEPGKTEPYGFVKYVHESTRHSGKIHEDMLRLYEKITGEKVPFASNEA